jgi:hypothetical protein
MRLANFIVLLSEVAMNNRSALEKFGYNRVNVLLADRDKRFDAIPLLPHECFLE